ncbi:DUF3105 domain-containing protein [Streptomyces griseolus]|uniref:DUF3105 domain-containing protein n=1 Tax=Streptomyces griseolus TaxID=1909 RepID=UPI0022431AC8|nr:DUF3105 domain-containing protein [Streptomyces griseolus]MCW8215789.1 DUF3105 domain-containing protein [Streptomyces griseolus]
MSFDRSDRVEQTPGDNRGRGRRNRAVAIGVSAVVVAGLLGFGSYTLLDRSEAKERDQDSSAQDAKQPEKAEATPLDGPIAGERTWDAGKLTRDHVTTEVTYPMEPPVGGDHNPAWLNCDGIVYEKAVPNVNAVHALEHGAVWVTYNGKAADADVRELASRVEKTAYALMSPYEGQAGAVMLTAWGKQVTVDGAEDPRVEQFFTKYVQGAQTPEPGAPCTGGVDG